MKTLILVASLFFSSTVFAQKPATKAVIQTPGVQCEVCKNTIDNRLLREYGMSAVKADYRKHTVTVTWVAGRTNIENIKTALANMGYDADDVTADTEAKSRLPKSCQHPVEEKK